MGEFDDVIPPEWQGNSSAKSTQVHKAIFPYDSTLFESKHGGFEGIVEIPSGYITFTATEVSVGFREINCVLAIYITDKKAGYLPPCRKRQLNLKSNSTVKDLISSLKNIYKEQAYKWDLIVEVFLSKLIARVESGDEPAFLTGEEPASNVQFLLYPFLQKDSATLLFADGDTGKSWFSLRLAVSIATGDPFLSYESPRNHRTLFLDYEDSKETFSERVRLLAAGVGKTYHEIAPFLSYKRMYSPIYDNVEQLRKFIKENDISLVILDAGADAAGGDAIDSEAVLKFYNALTRLETTSLVIHHEPKTTFSDKNSHFGSMYWKNRARIAWRLQKENEGDTKLIKATLTKKNNIKESIAPFYYTYREILNPLTEDDYQNLPAYPALVFEKSKAPEFDTPTATLLALKKHKELTYKQIGEIVGKSDEAIRKLVDRSLLPSKLVEIVPKGRGVVVRLKEGIDHNVF